jgi:hypothetical protein
MTTKITSVYPPIGHTSAISPDVAKPAMLAVRSAKSREANSSLLVVHNGNAARAINASPKSMVPAGVERRRSRSAAKTVVSVTSLGASLNTLAESAIQPIDLVPAELEESSSSPWNEESQRYSVDDSGRTFSMEDLWTRYRACAAQSKENAEKFVSDAPGIGRLGKQKDPEK